MYQIVKFVGVSPDQLASLHGTVKGYGASGGKRLEHNGRQIWFFSDADGKKCHPDHMDSYVSIVSVKLDREHNTYTVILKLLLVIPNVQCFAVPHDVEKLRGTKLDEAAEKAELLLRGDIYTPLYVMSNIYESLRVCPNGPRVRETKAD